MQDPHICYMQRALMLAQRGRLSVSPNPMVGCVLVKNGRIIGEGFHQRAGEPHAEFYALDHAAHRAKNATMYVTLEPCCHTGKTPPCTKAILGSDIRKIYIACLDPNPLVSGKGAQALEDAGIKVYVALCETKAKALNQIFFHFITNHRPYIISKWAMSLDGKTIAQPNDDRKISGKASWQHSHYFRQVVDAIVIGSKTAIYDNPQLIVRNEHTTKHPLRFILASKGNLPLNLKCFDPTLPNKTIVVTTNKVNKAWLKLAKEKNITIWKCATKNQRIDLHDFLKKLGEEGISSLLVEGGESLHASFFEEELVNEIQVYVAPKIISQLACKKNLLSVNATFIGEDLFLQSSFGKNSCLLAL